MLGPYKQQYESFKQNPAQFWLEQAKRLPWYKNPEHAYTQDTDGLYHWFDDGQLNTSFLALDQHVIAGFGEQTALIYDSPVTNTQQKYSYYQLQQEVAKFAGVMQSLGVSKGDRVVIYMPMIPQAVIGMLACARLGAIHSVVFGGFAAHELAVRIDDAKPKLILSASCGVEVDSVIEYKPLIDHAIDLANHKIDHCVIYQREQVDRVIDIDQQNAENTMRALARQEGIFAGVSSGGAVAGALQIAQTLTDAVIVAIICDRGDRYLSTGVFDHKSGLD